jgi:simple sugar transport system substrate-binding protein
MMKKKTIATALSLTALAFAATLHAQGKPQEIVTVVKITGISWFNRMEVGVKEFGAANPGVTTRQIGPAQSDAAQQQRLIEDLVAKKVDAIAVVSMDPPTLEPVLKRAMERGIKVVTHEADNQKNTMADVEAFDNTAYGARLNERLAACMGQQGKWTTLLGSLGSQSQVQWAHGGVANAKAKYPKMELVDPDNESFNDAEKAYAKAKEMLRKHPDLKGFQGSSSLDVLGIGRAVEEAGLQGKVCVYGTGLPSEAAKYLESGAVGGIAFWDPKDAGIVMNKTAKMLLDGKKLTDGMDMGVKGYEKVSVKKGPGVGVIIRGQAWVEVDKNNYKQFSF